KRLWLGQQGVYGSASLTNAERRSLALREWMLVRLESYFYESNRLSQLNSSDNTAAHGFPAAVHPALVSTNQLAAVVDTDADFLRVAEIYSGGPGFSVSKVV